MVNVYYFYCVDQELRAVFHQVLLLLQVIRPGLSLLHEPRDLKSSKLATSYHQFESQVLCFLKEKRAA
jgi:hypothetical protein